MQKNDIITLTIEDMGINGEGIGRYNGMTFFVKDAVVGDVLSARILKIKKTYGYAGIISVLTPSADREKPQCALYRKCGGCQIQPLRYEKQLDLKQKKIFDSLVRIGGFDREEIAGIFAPMVGMDVPYRYRNKAQFPVGTDKNGDPVVGFYAAHSHNIIPVSDCLLGVADNRGIVEAVLAYMKECHVPAYNETKQSGLIRHILIRYGFSTKEIMVCLIINGTKLPFSDSLVSRLALIEGMKSISVNQNRENTNVILGDRTDVIWGQAYITDRIRLWKCGSRIVSDSSDEFSLTDQAVSYHISPQSFYQVNPVQTEKLYSIALDFAGLTGSETVWDLYCGIGTISLFLAGHAREVYGVEIVPQAVADARENARRNGISNASFFCGKAEDILPAFYDRVVQSSVHGEHEDAMLHPDVIVVDPPRKGCDAKCLDTILKMQPQRIVYVSCDPATLARDLKVLCDGGYRLVKGRGVDQFCHTVHVETCVLLTHKNFSSYIEVTMDYEKIVPNQKPRKATYKMITDYVKEKYNLVVRSTTIAEVKRSFGFEVGDYNVKDEKTNYRKEKITPEKRQAVEDALRHFGVIE